MTTLRPGSRRTGWKRKALLVLASILLAPIAVEVLFRGWLRVRGEPYSAWATVKTMRQILNVLSQGVPMDAEAAAASAPNATRRPGGNPLDVLHPYFGIDFRGTLNELESQNVYFRSAEADTTFDVLVLGGSVAAGLAGPGDDQLQSTLAAHPAFRGRTIRVHNQGRGGFKQPQQTNVLAFLLSEGWKPDAVINVDGFNEVALALANAQSGANPLYPLYTEWAPFTSRGRSSLIADKYITAAAERRARARALVDRVTSWHLAESAVAGSLALARLTAMYNERVTATEAGLRELENDVGFDEAAAKGPPFNKDSVDVMDTAVRAWTEGSRSLNAMCAARSILYLHVLQPTLHDEGAKPATAREKTRGVAPSAYIDGVKAGYPRLRAEGARLRSEGVAFFDASGLFKNETQEIYLDHCHYNPVGNQRVIDAVSGALADLSKPVKK